mgnify:CR=1 FL=1
MPNTKRQMKLGVSMIGLGYHVAAWRHPDVPADGSPNIRHSVEVAQTAERGKLDMVFLADAVGIREYDEPPGALCRFSNSSRFEPITLLAALSMATQHIGLVATLSTTYAEPFHVARQFASLDHLSGGRAGWNVVTSVTPMEAQNFNYETTPDYDKRYGRAAEFVDVVRGLWDCWSDKAIIADLKTGRFFDESEVKPLNHEGPRFSVKGPINMGRCPQGQPVVLQAGGSERGQNLAARTADVVFSVVQDFEEARAAYSGLKERVRRFGRDPDSVTVLPGVMPIIGKTDAEARDVLNTLQGYVDSTEGLAMLSARLGTDISKYPLDGPIPDLPLPNTSHGFARALLAKGKRDNLSLRDLYNLTAAARGHWVLCGSVQTIADTLEKWFLEGAADGFNVMPAWFPGAFDEFVDGVVPELQRRGLYRKAYTGTTLRDHLGLSRPAIGDPMGVVQQSKAAAS